MLMFQVFVNVGMTIGIMPITGVPLPLMSYGGSSVLVTFIALGLLQSIYIQARLASAGSAALVIFKVPARAERRAVNHRLRRCGARASIQPPALPFMRRAYNPKD